MSAAVVQAYLNSLSVGPTAGTICLVGLVFLVALPGSFRCATLVLTICALGTLFALWLSRWVGYDD